MKIIANDIQMEVEDSGAGLNQHGLERPAVLLIMGLGMQLVAWPPAMVNALVDAGYRVIRHDNRDIGLSQNFDHLGNPNLVWAALKYRLGLAVKAPYRLHDMAADALGVLDALKVRRAHVVGVSMGGMIAQRVALAAPDRVLSLTSIMSSSGARGLPEAKPAVLKALIRRPANADAESLVNYYVDFFKLIASPAYPVAESELRERIQVGIRRASQPQGPSRQTLAIVADTARANELKNVRVPTLVLHGRSDPLVPYPCGEDTARRIPDALFVGIDGMGHDLAPGVVERLMPPMLKHINSVVA